MCNLYRHNIRISDIERLTAELGLDLDQESRSRNYEPDYTGADQDGPVLVSDGTTANLETMRWGFPGIPRDGKRETPITNIRNLSSSWWKNVNGQYLTEPDYRCLVPFSRFAEWNVKQKANSWFETTNDGPSFFAGIWRPWTGERLKSVEGKKRRERQTDDWRLYAFLTTEPNAVVKPIHPKAMPVILTSIEDCKTWMEGGTESLSLQRPLPEKELMIIED